MFKCKNALPNRKTEPVGVVRLVEQLEITSTKLKIYDIVKK